MIDDLTSRENEVADLLSKGHSYKKIAEQLGIKPSTVKKYACTIYEKLEVSGDSVGNKSAKFNLMRLFKVI